MQTQPRPSAKIRADALAMAAKKQSSGCDGCATAYIDLAREHGATTEQIARTGVVIPRDNRAARSHGDAAIDGPWPDASPVPQRGGHTLGTKRLVRAAAGAGLAAASSL